MCTKKFHNSWFSDIFYFKLYARSLLYNQAIYFKHFIEYIKKPTTHCQVIYLLKPNNLGWIFIPWLGKRVHSQQGKPGGGA
jgi:hypothetical protein